jgi:hypothetical protein
MVLKANTWPFLHSAARFFRNALGGLVEIDPIVIPLEVAVSKDHGSGRLL